MLSITDGIRKLLPSVPFTIRKFIGQEKGLGTPGMEKSESLQNITPSFTTGGNEFVVEGSCNHEILINPATRRFFKDGDSCEPEAFW